MFIQNHFRNIFTHLLIYTSVHLDLIVYFLFLVLFLISCSLVSFFLAFAHLPFLLSFYSLSLKCSLLQNCCRLFTGMSIVCEEDFRCSSNIWSSYISRKYPGAGSNGRRGLENKPEVKMPCDRDKLFHIYNI